MIYQPFIDSARCCLKVLSPFSERHLYTILPLQIPLLGGRGCHSTANNNCEARAAEFVIAGLKCYPWSGNTSRSSCSASLCWQIPGIPVLCSGSVAELPEEAEDVANPQGHPGLWLWAAGLSLGQWSVLQTAIAMLLKTLLAFWGKSLQLYSLMSLKEDKDSTLFFW